jgi:hypothetical protein
MRTPLTQVFSPPAQRLEQIADQLEETGTRASRCQRGRDAPGRPQRRRLARVRGLPDEVAGHLWSIARRAAQDAGRDPDALKTAMRINLEPGTSVDSLAGKLERFAGSGIDEAFVDAFALFSSLDQMLDFASRVIARTGRL